MSDLLTPPRSLQMWQEIVLISENQCSGSQHHRQPISEFIIDVSSLIRLCSRPSPRAPTPTIRWGCGEWRNPHPRFCEMVQKTAKEGHAPRYLSACVFGADLLWNFIYTPSSICQWKGKEVKEEGVPLQPTANLPSLLRCIIQCFSHNRLRLEGLSLPQPCGEQSANMEEAPNPRFHRQALWLFTLSYICVIYSACSSVAWHSDPSGQVGKHICPCRGQTTEVGEDMRRHQCGLSEWRWRSTTSRWCSASALLRACARQPLSKDRKQNYATVQITGTSLLFLPFQIGLWHFCVWNKSGLYSKTVCMRFWNFSGICWYFVVPAHWFPLRLPFVLLARL